MKKVLSFVLALAMILGCTAMAFADVDVKKVSADNTVLPFEDAQDWGVATVLRDIGALNGVGDDKVNLEGKLTRAEAATIVVRALGLDDLGKIPTKTTFKDVPADAWYSGYVAEAAKQKIVDGKGNGIFDPLANISMDECIALIDKVLGYRAEHLNGEWPLNYRYVAKSIGLLNGVTAGSADATRKEFFQVLYNALTCNHVEWVEEVKGGYVGSKDSTDAVKHWFSTETLFETITGLAKGLDSYYKVVTNPAVVIGRDSVKFDNGYNPKDFFGKTVTILQKNSAGGWKNIGIWGVATTTLEGKFTAKRNEAATFVAFTTLDGDEYTFVNASGEAVNWTSGTAITKFLNGVTVASLALNDKDTYKIEVTKYAEDGSKLTSLNAISIWKASEVAIVSKTQAADFAELDVVALNGAHALSSADFKVTNASVSSTKKVYLAGSCVVEGDVDKLEDIAEDDVVEIFVANGKIVKLVVTREKVTGLISRIDKSNTITVNGNAYKQATITADAITVSYGTDPSEYAKTEFDVYLNSAGQYVSVVETTEAPSTNLYAFVSGRLAIEDKIGEKAKTPITYYAIWLTVPGEDEVKYDTVKFATNGALEDEITPGAFVEYTLKDGALASITTAGLISPGGTVTKINANGIVTGIAGQKKVTSDTKIYLVVSSGATAKTDAKNYKVLTFDQVKGKAVSCASFVLGKNGKVDYIVLTNTGLVAGDQSVITGAAFLKAEYDNLDDADVYEYTFLTLDGEVTYTCDEKVDFTSTSFGSIKLKLGEYDGFDSEETSTVAFGIATVNAADLRDGVLTVSGASYWVDEDAQTWFIDLAVTGDTFKVVDFDDAVNDEFASYIAIYDVDGDEDADIILVMAGYVASNS